MQLKKEQKLNIFLISILDILSSIFGIIFAYFIRNITSSNGLCFVTLFLLLKVLFKFLFNVCYTKFENTLSLKLKSKLFSKIIGSTYQDINSFSSGEIVTRLTDDISRYSSLSLYLIPSVLSMAVTIGGIFILLFIEDWLLSLILVFVSLVYVGFSFLFSHPIKNIDKKISESLSNNRSIIGDSIALSLVIKSFKMENFIQKKNNSVLQQTYDNKAKKNNIINVFALIYDLALGCGLIFLVYWCISSFKYNSISLSLSVVYLIYLLIVPFSNMNSIAPAFYEKKACQERLQDILSFENESLNEIDIKDIERISIENLSYSYEDGLMVFKGFSKEINSGEILAVTGPSGIGKSTLVKLLLGIIKPQNGSLSVISNGKKIILNEQTRSLFAFVPQKAFIIPGTIEENITLGNSDVDIKKALELADAEFVYSLPNGLNTVLGINDTKISQGQAQRIALARAFASSRPILLLDEATSSLDKQSEDKILKNIKELKKTCIFISHRESVTSVASSVLDLIIS